MTRTSINRRPLLALSVILAGGVFCTMSAQSGAIPSDVTFRSNVSEVKMTFSATDQNNRVIGTIQPGDFAIVDQDSVVRNFSSFGRSEYTRLDVAVLVDASGSIAPQLPQELANVVQLIAQSDSVPDESFSIVSFHGLKPAVICEANCRALSKDAHFPVVTSGGLTPLYDSIAFTSRMLARDTDKHARKILILFSDGADTISLKSLSDAMNSALDNDVAIYAVDVSSQPRSSEGTQVLHNFAANTGGRYFPVEAGTSQVIDAMLADFRATYTVAYKLPKHADGFHLVRILPTQNLGLQFHCRRGYYYPSNQEN